MKQKILLSICIPTCNRKDKLVRTIREIIKCNDRRFLITISDNCSSDGLKDAISSINDDRIRLFELPQKILAYENYNLVLQFADSDYVLHVLDKEKFNVDYLSDFLDFLEEKRPCFGLVDIFGKSIKDRYVEYPKGVKSVLFGGGGGDTHPSGFFYRKDLYLNEFNRIKWVIPDGNLWVLDIVSAGLGSRFNSMVYYQPLITYDKNEILSGKTFSAYTEKSIYWYGKKRVETLVLFIKSIVSLECITNEEKENILYAMLEKHLINMTWTQKMFFSDKLRCDHYGLDTRNVGFFESIKWMLYMVDSFCIELQNKVKLRYSIILKIIMKCIRSSFKLNNPRFTVFLRKIKNKLK